MGTENSEVFSSEEKDILQEIMNIGFGNATADLAEIIDIFVELSVPDIKVIDVGGLPDYIVTHIKTYDDTTVIDQKFFGDFTGSGLLILPMKAARQLMELIVDSDLEIRPSSHQPMDTLEKEFLIEIGNILIGACVGKISELLDTFATYSQPQVVSESLEEYKTYINSLAPNQAAIVMKTVFKFEEKDLSGLLLITTNDESIAWLRKALHNFLESYE